MYSSASTVRPSTDYSFPSSCLQMKGDVFELGMDDIFEAVPPLEWALRGDEDKIKAF